MKKLERIDEIATIPFVLVDGRPAKPPEGVTPEGVLYDLKPGHYLILVDPERIDIEDLATAGTKGSPPMLPKGSSGGWIFSVYRGEFDQAMRIYRMEEKRPSSSTSHSSPRSS